MPNIQYQHSWHGYHVNLSSDSLFHKFSIKLTTPTKAFCELFSFHSFLVPVKHIYPTTSSQTSQPPTGHLTGLVQNSLSSLPNSYRQFLSTAPSLIFQHSANSLMLSSSLKEKLIFTEHLIYTRYSAKGITCIISFNPQTLLDKYYDHFLNIRKLSAQLG